MWQSKWVWKLCEEPKRFTKLIALSRACGEVPWLVWWRWASITRMRICNTALTAFGSRSRYQQLRVSGKLYPPFGLEPTEFRMVSQNLS